MTEAVLLAFLLGGLFGWFGHAGKPPEPCREFTVVEHLTEEEAARMTGLEVLDLEKGAVSLAEMKCITERSVSR